MPRVGVGYQLLGQFYKALTSEDTGPLDQKPDNSRNKDHMTN